jgi:hypothetical protein
MSMNNLNETIGNRTRILLAFSAAPETTAPTLSEDGNVMPKHVGDTIHN